MNIKSTINRHGFTLQQIADKLGISQQAVSQAVNGNPSLSRLQEIAGAIGISVSELLADEQPSADTIITCPKCGHAIRIKVADSDSD